MRIPKTFIRTTWRADWLSEFSIALIALAFLAREIIFVAVGAGILLSLVSLVLLFHRRLGVLRSELHVAERLPKTRVCLGDSIEGDLTIRNGSRLAAQILAVTAVVEKGLSFELSSSSNQSIRPGTTSSSKFEITSLKSGRFRISGFTLTFIDSRGLFTDEVNYEQADRVEVYPSVRTKAPITPLRLYGGGPEIFRKGPAGMDYAGVRQYTPGDESHRIEWKATARLRTLMVKEFHPETQATLQILIDAGRTMHQRSYIGTRLDEALAVAELLTESAAPSRTPLGIWVYDENGLLRVIKPAMAIEQVPRLRELSLALQAKNEGGESFASPSPPRTFLARFFIPGGERVAAFTRLLKTKLGMVHRNTGAYKALTEAARMVRPGTLVLLTDLEINAEALFEAASILQKQGVRIVIAQVAAGWRLSDDPELTYAEYQRNSRILRQMELLGVSTFDLRPERLVEAIAQEISKPLTVTSVNR